MSKVYLHAFKRQDTERDRSNACNVFCRMKGFAVMLVMLGLAGCVHVSNPPMPTEWPALVTVAPEKFNGIYSGSLRDKVRFSSAFFSVDQLYDGGRFQPQGFRVMASEAGCLVEALGRDGVIARSSVTTKWGEGALLVERKHTGSEGLAVATYRDRWFLRLNSAGELVIEHRSASVGILFPIPGGESSTDWIRLTRSNSVN